MDVTESGITTSPPFPYTPPAHHFQSESRSFSFALLFFSLLLHPIVKLMNVGVIIVSKTVLLLNHRLNSALYRAVQVALRQFVNHVSIINLLVYTDAEMLDSRNIGAYLLVLFGTCVLRNLRNLLGHVHVQMIQHLLLQPIVCFQCRLFPVSDFLVQMNVYSVNPAENKDTTSAATDKAVSICFSSASFIGAFSHLFHLFPRQHQLHRPHRHFGNLAAILHKHKRGLIGGHPLRE